MPIAIKKLLLRFLIVMIKAVKCIIGRPPKGWITEVERILKNDSKRKCLRRVFWVYQPGKVGSSSIVKTLQNGSCNAIHVHHLRLKNIYKHARMIGTLKEIKNVFGNIVMGHLFSVTSGPVIVSVRDPETHLNSLTFQDLPKYILASKISATRHMTVAELFAYIHANNDVLTNYLDHWLTHEFLVTTGIDVSGLIGKKLPFSLECMGRSYLFVRFEDLNHPTTLSALSKFTGIPDLKLEKRNHSRKKWYASLQKEIRENYKVDNELEKRLRSTSFSKTFGYTERYTPFT